MIEELSPEQEALIPVYREKWRAIALSTEPVEPQKVSLVVTAYMAISQEDLNFLFCDSPDAVLSQSLTQLESHLWGPPCQSLLQRQLIGQMVKQIERELWRKLRKQLTKELESQLWIQVWSQIQKQLWNQPPSGHQLYPHHTLLDLPYLTFSPNSWIYIACFFDFCISVLGCKSDSVKWEVFQSVAKNLSGGIFLFKNTLVACARPTVLYFDNEQRLHAEGSPAIQFADGYSLYSYHGVTLPKN